MCAYPGCGEPLECRGFCNRHYKQWRRGVITLSGEELRPLQGPRKPCKIEGCDTLSGGHGGGRGFCSRHYQQWSVGIIDLDGNVLRSMQAKEKQAGRKCSVERCSRSSYAKGFCQNHYSSYYTGARSADGVLRSGKVTNKGECCLVTGCYAAARCRGMCQYHYDQLRAGILNEDGSPGRPKRARSEVRRAKGYVYRMVKDHPYASKTGYVSEHRLVMEEHLGRYLALGEIVHHVNGVKDDNRISNLRLMTKASEHNPFYERIVEIEEALEVLECLVNAGMTNHDAVQKRLGRLYRRLVRQSAELRKVG
jgi:hypothetical protein